ncbi:MAG: MerR family transcriptional regulator [Prevotella sp.]|nr:MerR family transcriptional regulator [Prevotella sp.]MDY4218455.1 MerR family transcriptional regulator [Prevotella sp.]
MENIYNLTPTQQNCYSGEFLEVMINFIKSIVEDSMKKVIQNKMYENVVVNQLLTTEQLCKRWGICRTTLHTWEKNGIISPVQTGGRKKMYSIQDVREVEGNGYIKNISLVCSD